MAEKVDLKKALDTYKASQSEFQLLDVPPMQYVMVDGHGDPNSSTRYAAAVEALFTVSYACSLPWLEATRPRLEVVRPCALHASLKGRSPLSVY